MTSPSDGASGTGVDPEYFRRMYAADDDPWGFADRWYEARKYDLTMALLPRRQYERGLELGSSIGVLSARLTQRCRALTCLELEPRAAALARARLAGVADRVTVRVADITEGIGEEPYDLIVASEVLYYLDEAHLGAMSRTLDRRRRAGATIVCVHWRHVVGEYPWTGDEVHERLRRALGPAQAGYVDDDVVMDVFTPPDEPGVAAADGLVSQASQGEDRGQAASGEHGEDRRGEHE